MEAPPLLDYELLINTLGQITTDKINVSDFVSRLLVCSEAIC